MSQRRWQWMLPLAFVLAATAAGCGAGEPEGSLTLGSPESVGMDPTALDSAVELYRDAVEEDEIRGVVVLVARHGRVVVHEAIGWRDKENGLAMERNSLFRMASNTKPVIATAVLMLAEAGNLAVGDPVSRYLPAFANGENAEITIHHLLTHTSGLDGSIFIEPLLEETSLQAEVTRFAEVGPASKPGSIYDYSNRGYNTLGAVIEIVSGMDLAAFLHERIYLPLGMLDSGNHESTADHSRMSKVYRMRDGEWYVRWAPGDAPDYPFVRASGGMISTAWDYSIFLQTWLNRGEFGGVRLFSREMAALGTQPHTEGLHTSREADQQQTLYGYGWMIGGP